MKKRAPQWLEEDVLHKLQTAIGVLVDALVGRACGPSLFEQRQLADHAARTSIEAALAAYERRAAMLTEGERRRTAAIFAAAFALRCRVVELHGRADPEVENLVQRAENVLN